MLHVLKMKSSATMPASGISVFVLVDDEGQFYLRKRYYSPHGTFYTGPDRALESMPSDADLAREVEN